MLTRKKKKESATANFEKFLKATNCTYTTTEEKPNRTYDLSLIHI